MQAQMLRQQIEWKLDHVPRKLQNMTMGELLAQHSNMPSESWQPILESRSKAIQTVKEVQRLRYAWLFV